MADRKDAVPATRASAGHWPAWSTQFHWVARAKAHDALIVSTEQDCHAQIKQHRLGFQTANSLRIEARITKTRALLAKAAQAPASDTEKEEITRIQKTDNLKARQGRVVEKKTTYFEGINSAGVEAVRNQLAKTIAEGAKATSEATVRHAVEARRLKAVRLRNREVA
jgi:hypothetical protein